MTREEAVRLLKKGSLAYSEVEAKAFCEAYDMAIKALEVQTDDDLISRQSAMDACLNGWNKDFREILKDISTLPSEYPKIGRWITEKAIKRTYCSECKGIGYMTPYCSHCGAKMT